jgi:hypothetical protein
MKKRKWAGPYTRPGCAVLGKHRPGRCIGFAATACERKRAAQRAALIVRGSSEGAGERSREIELAGSEGGTGLGRQGVLRPGSGAGGGWAVRGRRPGGEGWWLG